MFISGYHERGWVTEEGGQCRLWIVVMGWWERSGGKNYHGSGYCMHNFYTLNGVHFQDKKQALLTAVGSEITTPVILTSSLIKKLKLPDSLRSKT